MIALSLYSGGCDGLSLAASWVGIETVAYCDSEAACRAVLRARHPDAPIFSSDEEVTADGLRAHGIEPAGIDIVMGGPPCQIASVAGKRLGAGDPRNRWPEFLRIIRDLRPRWILAENVPGLLSVDAGRLFGEILRDLAQMGYGVSWGCWGAADVGAPHGRQRLFIVGHAECAERGTRESARHVANGDAVQREEAAGGLITSGENDAELADARYEQQQRRRKDANGGEWESCGQFASCDPSGYVADTNSEREQQPRWEQPQGRGWTGNGDEGVADASIERCARDRGAWRRRPGPADGGCMEHAESKRRKERNFAAVTQKARFTGRRFDKWWRDGTIEPGLGRGAARLSGWLDEAARRLEAQRWPHPRLKDGPSPQYDWEPPRVAAGIHDRAVRLKMIGNSCPPQQYLVALAAIAEAERMAWHEPVPRLHESSRDTN